MADQTFMLLKAREGMKTSINGATQIRAGVVRPEILIPLVSDPVETVEVRGDGSTEGILEVGSSVRIIRDPYFGQLGRVTKLPVELQNLETEARVRVLRVELEDGQETTLPRANVEAIEG